MSDEQIHKLVSGKKRPLTEADIAQRESDEKNIKNIGPIRPISNVRFFGALAKLKLITEEEAIAAVSSGEMPNIIETTIQEMPKTKQFKARMTIQGESSFNMNDDVFRKLFKDYEWDTDEIQDAAKTV